MKSNEDRPDIDGSGQGASGGLYGAGALDSISRLAGSIRTAPRGPDSRIGDDETHRRLQEARNRARHSTESIIRRELGPEWALEQ
jgi:hypothetical protein